MLDAKIKNWGSTLLLLLFGLSLILIPIEPSVAKSKYKKGKPKKEKKFSFPLGCRQAGFELKHYVLSLKPPKAGNDLSMYFIYNNSKHSVTLYQMRTGDEDFVMHANNTIHPKRWAVFASGENEVNFICSYLSRKYKYGYLTDCGKALKLCEYTNVKFGLNNTGNYWAVRNGSKRGSMRSVNYQGILLRW